MSAEQWVTTMELPLAITKATRYTADKLIPHIWIHIFDQNKSTNIWWEDTRFEKLKREVISWFQIDKTIITYLFCLKYIYYKRSQHQWNKHACQTILITNLRFIQNCFILLYQDIYNTLKQDTTYDINNERKRHYLISRFWANH